MGGCSKARKFSRFHSCRCLFMECGNRKAFASPLMRVLQFRSLLKQVEAQEYDSSLNAEDSARRLAGRAFLH